MDTKESRNPRTWHEVTSRGGPLRSLSEVKQHILQPKHVQGARSSLVIANSWGSRQSSGQGIPQLVDTQRPNLLRKIPQSQATRQHCVKCVWFKRISPFPSTVLAKLYIIQVAGAQSSAGPTRASRTLYSVVDTAASCQIDFRFFGWYWYRSFQ